MKKAQCIEFRLKKAKFGFLFVPTVVTVRNPSRITAMEERGKAIGIRGNFRNASNKKNTRVLKKYLRQN
jgi:hypothetical protein